MNSVQRGITLLMKSSATGQSLPLPDDFSLEDALPIIQAHKIAPLAYAGAVSCGIDPQTPALMELLPVYCAQLLQSERQMAQVRRIYQCFQAHGIDHLPLKGCVMKARYPRPDLRSMGDADILIRMEQYEQIIPLMESLGFSPCCESENELSWRSDGLYLELHRWLLPTSLGTHFRYFQDIWNRARPVSGTQYEMPPEEELLFQVVHFTKHYRNGGIGCRHVLDLYVLLRTFPQLDQQFVEAELSKLKLLTFYRNLRRLLAYWFEDGETDPVVEHMTQFLFASGNWGATQNQVSATVLRESKEGTVTRTIRLRTILQMIFLPRQDLAVIYPIVDRHPWLLPIMWVWRWFDIAFRRRGNVRRRLKSLRLLDYQQITSFRQSLEYVGLDCNPGAQDES